MEAIGEFFSEAPPGAVILGAIGIVLEAVFTTIFVRRVAERDRAGPDAPEELHAAVKNVVPLLPIGFVLWFLALVWWVSSR